MPVSLLSKLSDVPLAFVDVETTGASPLYGDRVIEIGIARVHSGKIVETYQQLVDPLRPIGPGITALTGITPDMCAGQPLFSDICHRIADLLRDSVIVGHNVSFDLGFLRNEFRHAGRDLPRELPGALVMDTVRIARKLRGRGGNGLQKLAAHFNVLDTSASDASPVAHRALADALTTHRVFEKLISHYHSTSTSARAAVRGGKGGDGGDMTLVDAIQLQGGVMKIEGTPTANALPYELEEALAQRGPVEMEYVDARESRTVRIVTPIEVRKFRGELVLLAYCDMRKDRRTFKLDRIVRLSRIDPDSQLPPSLPSTPSPSPIPKSKLNPTDVLIKASDLLNKSSA